MTGRELAALAGQESIVVIRRPFVQWLGNIGRALLFDQLLFESDARGGGWLAITDDDWQNRLLLSRREIRDARDHLTGLGILESEQRGMPRRTWYRLDTDKAAKAFSDHLETGGASTLEWPIGRARLTKRAGKSGQLADHSIQGGEGVGKVVPVGGGANDAPRRDAHASGDDALRDADVEQRELDRAARHSLGLTIAAEVGVNPEDAVYRKGKQAGRLNADFGEMVGQVRKVAGSYPAAFLVWGAFRDSVPDAEWERFGAIGAVKTRFNRWAANGGVPKIEQARAMFGGGS